MKMERPKKPEPPPMRIVRDGGGGELGLFLPLAIVIVFIILFSEQC
jgi:hypothetical protein